MPKQTEGRTPKTAGKAGEKRTLVVRGLPPLVGSSNLIVLKRGEDLRANLEKRLNAMKADFEKVEFWWSKVVQDFNFNDSREYREYGPLVAKWELEEGVRDLIQYKAKMRRFETLIEHFQPGHDYELTVQEAVEVLS